MNAVADIVAAEEAGASDPAIARAEARLRDLEEVRGICMSIARVVQKQALAQADLQDVGDRAGAKEVLGSNVVTLMVRGDFGLVIDRVARSVRLTVMLEEKQEKVIRDLKAGVGPGSADPVARRRREAVEQVVMTAVHAKHGRDTERVERDREHLGRYLDRADLTDRPVSESVRRLCDMLGLRPDWRHWVDESWADEEAKAGIAGSPYRLPEPKPVKAAAPTPGQARPRSQTTDAGPPADSS